MFTVLLTVSAMVADDPAVVMQRKYPVHTTRLITASGTYNYYFLPPGTPLELRRAYDVLQVAEREAELAERVQHLKAEYVENERRLEAARTAREIFELQSFRPGGLRGYGRSRGYYGGGYYMPTSPLKANLSGVIADVGVPERAIQAMDRVAQARQNVRRALLELAAREKGPPAAPPVTAVRKITE